MRVGFVCVYVCVSVFECVPQGARGLGMNGIRRRVVLCACVCVSLCSVSSSFAILLERCCSMGPRAAVVLPLF